MTVSDIFENSMHYVLLSKVALLFLNVNKFLWPLHTLPMEAKTWAKRIVWTSWRGSGVLFFPDSHLSRHFFIHHRVCWTLMNVWSTFSVDAVSVRRSAIVFVQAESSAGEHEFAFEINMVRGWKFSDHCQYEFEHFAKRLIALYSRSPKLSLWMMHVLQLWLGWHWTVLVSFCTRVVTRGRNYPRAESLWGRRITAGEAPKSPNNVTSSFFHTAHLLPKDLRFEYGAPNLLLAPGAI